MYNRVVLERHRHVEQAFVEAWDKRHIKQMAVKDGKTQQAACKLEKEDIVDVSTCAGIDLERVVVIPTILEHAEARIKHLHAQQIEPLARKAAIVKATCHVLVVRMCVDGEEREGESR